MAGICKRCKGETTDTRAASPTGLCFGCQHNPCQGTIHGCLLPRRECNQKYLHGEAPDQNPEDDNPVLSMQQWYGLLEDVKHCINRYGLLKFREAVETWTTRLQK